MSLQMESAVRDGGGRLDAWRRGEYRISTERTDLDLDVIHAFLVTSYWAPGITRPVLERSIEHSLCFGLYQHDRQVGFARVITDRATYAYLADVFVLEQHRGQGLATWLLEVIAAHPELQSLRRFTLVTRDAHPLYAKLGFHPLRHPARYMERTFDPYRDRSAASDTLQETNPPASGDLR